MHTATWPLQTCDRTASAEQSRQARQEVADIVASLTHVGFPVRMTDFRFAVARQAPAAGEHTDEVLRELGHAEQDIAALRASRAAC